MGDSLTMVETDSIISWVECEPKVKDTNAPVEHLEE